VPIVPVSLGYDDPALCWTGDATFVPHYLATAARPSSRVHLHFGAALVPRPGDDAADLARRARAAILFQLGATDYEPTSSVRLSAPRPDAVLSAAGR
jgi:hypothetical protein